MAHSLDLLFLNASSSPNPFPEKTSVTPERILHVAAASDLRATGSGACRMTSTAVLMGATPNLAARTAAQRPNARLIVARCSCALVRIVRRISLRHVASIHQAQGSFFSLEGKGRGWQSSESPF